MNKPRYASGAGAEDDSDTPLRFALPEDERLPYGRGALSALVPAELVRARLGRWTPYPTRAERASWGALPSATRDALVARADEAAAAPWPELRASTFVAFARRGERTDFDRAQHLRRHRLRDLVLGCCVTGDNRYDDALLDALWSICEESFWGSPAHAYPGRPDAPELPDLEAPVVDLFAAETAAQLGWTRYLLGAHLSRIGGDVLGSRLVAEIDRRVLVPFERRDDWHWLGIKGRGANNWTTWIGANLLVCLLLVETDAARRAGLVSKVVAALDVYLHHMPADGGCSEGQSYWAQGPARLVDCLDALHAASAGGLDGFGLAPLAGVCRYPLAMHVDGRTMVQHADGHGEWTAEPSVLHRAGRLLGEDRARQLAVHLRDQPPGKREKPRGDLWRALSELFEPGYPTAPAQAAPAVPDLWFPDLQVLSAREMPESRAGLMACMKAGHNSEYHNHNDVGGVSVLHHGQHVVVDPGSGVYTKETFGPRRYELWAMRSDAHSLPLIGGHPQARGREHAARDVTAELTDDRARLAADLAGAWPSEAGVVRYTRTLTLDRVAGQVVLTDDWELAMATSVVLPVLLAVEPRLHQGLVQLPTDAGGLQLAVEGAQTSAVEPHELTDLLLRAQWGPQLWRLVLTPPAGRSGRLRLTFGQAA